VVYLKPKQLIIKDCARRFVLKQNKHEASRGLFATAELLVFRLAWRLMFSTSTLVRSFVTKVLNMERVCCKLAQVIYYISATCHLAMCDHQTHWDGRIVMGGSIVIGCRQKSGGIGSPNVLVTGRTKVKGKDLWNKGWNGQHGFRKSKVNVTRFGDLAEASFLADKKPRNEPFENGDLVLVLLLTPGKS